MRKNVVVRVLAIVMGLGLVLQPVAVMAKEPPIELKERNPYEKFLKTKERINREELIPSFEDPKGIRVPTDPILKPNGNKVLR